ncbi:hypothetical protein K1I93_09655, partial [Streptococcus australis]|nr:hypothetical protein [Streptococcus australis]
HNAGLTHLDLSPDNMLISPKNYEMRLCDLSQSTPIYTNKLRHKEKLNSIKPFESFEPCIGKIEYIPPECWKIVWKYKMNNIKSSKLKYDNDKKDGAIINNRPSSDEEYKEEKDKNKINILNDVFNDITIKPNENILLDRGDVIKSSGYDSSYNDLQSSSLPNPSSNEVLNKTTMVYNETDLKDNKKEI